MTQILEMIKTHPLVVYYLLSVAVGQLPMPTTTSSSFYRWFFGTSQIIAANWSRGKIGLNGGAPYDATTGLKLKE